MEKDSNTRWNFVALTLDAAFFVGAFAFVQPVAVLPVFVRTLTDSTVAIGALTAIQQAGWILPQLAAASFLQHRPRKMPFLMSLVIIGRLPFAPLAIIILLMAKSDPALVLAAVVTAYVIFCFTDGMTLVGWNDIVAKCIRPTLRGRLFGGQQFLGGGIAVIAGETVRRVLASDGMAYPANYAFLFGLYFAGMMLSAAFLALVREPIRPVVKERQNLAQMVKRIPGALREKPEFLRMVKTQLLGGIGFIAVPFYVIYAETRLGAPPWTSGVFIWAGTVGAIGGSLIWAYLSDLKGSTRVIRAVCWLGVTAPLVAIAVPFLPLTAPMTYYAYAIVFTVASAAGGGSWIGFTNFLLEITQDEERIAFIGMNGTLLAPTALMPVIGGLLLKFFPYEAVFALAAMGGLLALLNAYRLTEPRTLAREPQMVPEGSSVGLAKNRME